MVLFHVSPLPLNCRNSIKCWPFAKREDVDDEEVEEEVNKLLVYHKSMLFQSRVVRICRRLTKKKTLKVSSRIWTIGNANGDWEEIIFYAIGELKCRAQTF